MNAFNRRTDRHLSRR